MFDQRADKLIELIALNKEKQMIGDDICPYDEYQSSWDVLPPMSFSQIMTSSQKILPVHRLAVHVGFL